MYPFPKIMLIFAAISMLAACDHIQGGRKTQSTSSETVTTPAQSAATIPSDSELRMMTSRLSNGSVEIYDIGEGEIRNGAPDRRDSHGLTGAGGVPPVMQDAPGIPLASDPRVTIYPLDASSIPLPVPSYPGPLAPEWPPTSVSELPEPGKLPSRVGGGVSSIYFNYGSAEISQGDTSVLSSVAETAKFAPVERVNVEGHASSAAQTSDPVKAKVLNLKESMNRAMAVSQDLIQRGVPAEKLKTIGWGDTKPSGAGEAQQRRVDIVTTPGQ